MLPTLQPGDYVIADTRALEHVESDALVVAREPTAKTIVVKRVRSRGDSTVYLGSDNPNEGRDSRHFGSIPIDALLGEVVLHLGVGRLMSGR